MANVNIPTTNVDPNEQDTGKLVRQLLNAYIVLTEELTFLLNNLDTRNINEVDGDILVSGTITGDKIQANTITAGKLNVNELSAISADLGHIVAGLIESIEIYGSYISTNRTGYPRAEMSNTANMFGASKSPGNTVQIYSPVERLSPVLKFETGGVLSYIFYDPSDNVLSVTSNAANINLSSQGRIELYAPEVRVISWNQLINNSTGRTLAEDLGL